MFCVSIKDIKNNYFNNLLQCNFASPGHTFFKETAEIKPSFVLYQTNLIDLTGSNLEAMYEGINVARKTRTNVTIEIKTIYSG